MGVRKRIVVLEVTSHVRRGESVMVSTRSLELMDFYIQGRAGRKEMAYKEVAKIGRSYELFADCEIGG
jgi:hypothetical protein